jgi:hypothetical protein
MPGLFSRLKGRDGKLKSKKGTLDDLANHQPQKPRWEDAWTRKTVEPDEVHQLIRFCTEELKARGMTSNLTCSPAAPALHIRKWSPVPQPHANNGLLQLSISPSYSSHSGRLPTRAPSAPSCDTILTAKMAARCCAGRLWPRNCG